MVTPLIKNKKDNYSSGMKFNNARSVWHPIYLFSKWEDADGIDWVTIAILLSSGLDDPDDSDMVVLCDRGTLLVMVKWHTKLFNMEQLHKPIMPFLTKTINSNFDKTILKLWQLTV